MLHSQCGLIIAKPCTDFKCKLSHVSSYCSPEYTFPTQQEVISFAASTAFELVTLNQRTLVVCGSYSVGKEKVFLGESFFTFIIFLVVNKYYPKLQMNPYDLRI